MSAVYLPGDHVRAVLDVSTARDPHLELRRIERVAPDDTVVEEIAGVLDAPAGVSLTATGNALMGPAIERLCRDMDDVPVDLERACAESPEPREALAELDLGTLECLLSRIEHDSVLYEQGVRDLEAACMQASAAVLTMLGHGDRDDARNIERQEQIESLLDDAEVRLRIELAADHIMRTDWWDLEVMR